MRLSTCRLREPPGASICSDCERDVLIACHRQFKFWLSGDATDHLGLHLLMDGPIQRAPVRVHTIMPSAETDSFGPIPPSLRFFILECLNSYPAARHLKLQRNLD